MTITTIRCTLLAASIAALPACTAMTVSDLAGRALAHPGIDTIDIRGGKLYESPDLRMKFRPVRDQQEAHDVAR
jgi:hypothetical protein